MGTCISIIEEEDDDDKKIRIRDKKKADELRHFQQQLRKQKCHSELDLSGKARVKVPPVASTDRLYHL